MNAYCGLDFGTSNSTIGICPNSQCQLIPLENNKATIRSAIFCDVENKRWVFGQRGIDQYLNGTPGRLMMALKSVLGSSLMEDETFVFDEMISYTKILSHFIRHIKTIAEKQNNNELTHVVLGRPVFFDDNDPIKDKYAQDTLEKIMQQVGFKEITFQYEPIAAALTYEMSIVKEQLALIIDMGGGTSDFTVIRLQPNNKLIERHEDVLANCGIHIAGTDFDQKLSLNTVMPLLGLGTFMQGSSSMIEVPSAFYHDLTTWHTFASLYSAKTISHIRSIHVAAKNKELIARLIRVLQTRSGHHILDAVETCKKQLSDLDEVALDLNFIEDDLLVNIKRETLNKVIDDYLQRIIAKIMETIKLASVAPENISAIFYTGGSTNIPIIREKINALFPSAEVVKGDAFGSVGLGLTIAAKRKYGC